jgi:predicted ATPase
MHLKSVTLCPEKYPTRERYPFNLTIFQDGAQFTFDAPVTLFVGENGTGKSTLIEAIARKCDIHIWADTESLRYDANPYEDRFYTCLTAEWQQERVPGAFFGSRNFRYFSQVLDEWAATDPGQLRYFGGKSLMTQSHGQSLMAYFTSRYQIRGLYVMDEPETALSPRSQLALLRLLAETSQTGQAQYIIATHSPILLACPGATIYSFDQTPIQRVRYEDTQHYQLYRDFMLQGAQACL